MSTLLTIGQIYYLHSEKQISAASQTKYNRVDNVSSLLKSNEILLVKNMKPVNTITFSLLYNEMEINLYECSPSVKIYACLFREPDTSQLLNLKL